MFMLKDSCCKVCNICKNVVAHRCSNGIYPQNRQVLRMVSRDYWHLSTNVLGFEDKSALEAGNERKTPPE